MANKRTPRRPSKTGNVTTISIKGNQNAVATQGGRASVTQVGNALADELEDWRKGMEREINSLKELPAEDKATLSHQVGQITLEARKGKQADPGRIERLLNTMAGMAPDILEVAITTLVNPLAGLGLVAKKIGEKAQVTQKV